MGSSPICYSSGKTLSTQALFLDSSKRDGRPDPPWVPCGGWGRAWHRWWFPCRLQSPSPGGEGWRPHGSAWCASSVSLREEGRGGERQGRGRGGEEEKQVGEVLAWVWDYCQRSSRWRGEFILELKPKLLQRWYFFDSSRIKSSLPHPTLNDHWILNSLLLRVDPPLSLTWLRTERFIFVDVEVKHMDLAICSDSCKDCGGEGRPRHVPNHTVEVKGEHCVSVESGRRWGERKRGGE